MKEFNVATLDNYGELIIHLQGDNGNYDVTYNAGQLIFENDKFKYTVPADKGNKFKFKKPDRNTGKSKYIADNIRTLYRDTSDIDSALTPVINANPNAAYLTGTITVGGLSAPSPVVAPNDVNIFVNSIQTASGTTVNNNDSIYFEVTSPKLGDTTKTVDLSIGNITHSFSVTTKNIPWEVIMHTNSNKTNIGVGLEAFAWAGTIQFDSADETNTGAENRITLNDGVGVYNAFFKKKNITKLALVSGDGDLSNPLSHSHYLIYNLVESTGNESLYDIIHRLDRFNRSNVPNWTDNDTAYNDPKVIDFTAGTNGYSGTLTDSGGDWKTVDNETPSKIVVWGINRDANNDAQVLCAFNGDLESGKGDNWRGVDPAETLWSFWGNDWDSNSQTQSIANSVQSSPGLADSSTGSTQDVYLIAL